MNRELNAIETCELGPSQLFLLRVWPGNMPGQNDWQGKLQYTVTGERRYFKSWEELRQILSEIMSPHRAGQLGDKPHSKRD